MAIVCLRSGGKLVNADEAKKSFNVTISPARPTDWIPAFTNDSLRPASSAFEPLASKRSACSAAWLRFSTLLNFFSNRVIEETTRPGPSLKREVL